MQPGLASSQTAFRIHRSRHLSIQGKEKMTWQAQPMEYGISIFFFYMFTISTMVLLSDNLEAKKPKLSAQAISLRKLNKHKLSCAERQK